MPTEFIRGWVTQDDGIYMLPKDDGNPEHFFFKSEKKAHMNKSNKLPSCG